uniref:CBM39 domain-containing protein n=1 Tax=Anopheles minimus TaxID=112268 RepID=A0A182WH39_9DIPT
MKFAPKSISPPSCPANSPKSQMDNHAAEKILLEEIINDLLSSCETVDTSKALVLIGDCLKNMETLETESELKRYAIGRLNSLLPAIRWEETVGTVYISWEKIIFNVETVLMKLKILHTIRGTDVAKLIIDFDDLSRSASRSDDSSEELYFEFDSDRMKFAPSNVPPQSCRMLRPIIVTPSQHRNYTAEKTMLEETINELLASYQRADLNTMLTLAYDRGSVLPLNELKRYVIDRLNSLLPEVDWEETVDEVGLSEEGIFFDVKTVLMKLKILHTIRHTDAAKSIFDFTYEEGSDDYDEYDIGTVKMPVSRKQHLLTTIALVWLVVASCLLESVDARRGSRRHSRRPKSVNIEIYHPKGVMIWHPYRAGMEMFGIKLYINKANLQAEQDSGEEESTPVACDICLNTTEVTYGKFILRSEDVIIRRGDHVLYKAIVKKTSGEEYVSHSKDFYVSESRILQGDITGAASSVCTREKVNADLPDSDKKLVSEIKLLEEILGKLSDDCAGDGNRTKQLMLSAETDTRYDAKQLYQYVAEELERMMPTINWNQTLVETFYASKGIGFEVATTVDKLKVLHLAKKLPTSTITDMDNFQTEDMTNDIDFWV